MVGDGKKQAAADQAESGRGLGFLSLGVGLATGGTAYLIIDRWIDASTPSPVAVTVLQSIVAFSAGWLLLSERRDFLRPLIPAAVIAALLAWPSWFMASAHQTSADDLNEFPFLFWFFACAPLAFYLMLTFAKATLESGLPPKYPSIFFHGLTLPLVAGGAQLFAGLALILLFAWAALLKQMDVSLFSELFDEPWFIMPFLGAIGGLSIAMIRGQQPVLGALRYMLLLFSRISMPIMALFSATFLIVLAMKGPGAILDSSLVFGKPGGVALLLALFGMLVFNGVYQNGEGPPPPAWLRLSTAASIATFPAYTGLAFMALWTRVSDYGLTPPRIGGLIMITLAFAYSIVLVGGLVTELNPRGKKWMPFVAPLNVAMAAVWTVMLLALSSPLFNSWEMSARSQERLLLAGKVKAEAFDFGYLQFHLGASGAAALDRLDDAADHPEAIEIREGVARARRSLTYWEYQNPVVATPIDEAPPGADGPPSQPGPLDLEFNPENDAGEIAADDDV